MASPANKPASPRDAGPTPTVTGDRRPEQRTLSLSLPADAPVPVRRAPQLWLCLYLPHLPLEAVSSPDAAERPRAVFEERQGLRLVLEATLAARRAGVHPGLSVNAALALVPGLELAARDPERERRMLRRLAGRAERYTSLVVVEAEAALLLEIAASLRLFGGLEVLRQRVLRDIEQQGFTPRPAIAPTPLAATWLARAGERRVIRRTDRLAGVLGRLPLDCLDWPESVTATMQGMGITRIADCLRLPRAGFARRFGAERLLELDRALGRLPDPRESHRSPARFCADSELDAEQSDSERLLAVCEPLLEKLDRFLLTRQLSVQRLEFAFYHLEAPATRIRLGVVQAERGTGQWRELLRLRLTRVVLPEPVIAIRLQSGEPQPFTTRNAPLPFERTARPHGGSGNVASPRIPMTHLVERLCTRIGSSAVHGVDAVAEHRPDRAFRIRPLDETPRCRADTPPWYPWYEQQAPQVLADMRRTGRLLLERPLWMLERPEPLACCEAAPCYEGPLTLESGPERIESGWWDEAGVARDYYVALNPAGVHLWVYRDRNGKRGWYLHGIFG